MIGLQAEACIKFSIGWGQLAAQNIGHLFHGHHPIMARKGDAHICLDLCS